MSRKSRVLAVSLACLLAFSFLFCTLWMSVNAAHTCTRKCCMVCAQINTLENALRKLFAADQPSDAAAAMLCLAVSCAPLYFFALFRHTLVSLKVKLSD